MAITGRRPAALPVPTATVWRVRAKADFERLRQTGRTRRSGVLAVRWCPPAAEGPPQVAYAIGRPVGNAVARNRLRRQLRHIVQSLCSQGDLPHGISLIMAKPQAADLTFGELTATLTDLFGRFSDDASGQPS